MKREIFRTSALNRMSSPEQLDQMLQVTSTRSWIALLAIGVVLVAGLIWGIWGRIATKSPGKGVAIRAGNLVTVGSLGAGRVVSVDVRAGDIVHKGQVIGSVSQPLLKDKLDAAKSDLEKLHDRVGPQSAMTSTNLGLEVNALQGQNKTIEDEIAAINDQRKELKEQIASTQELLDKGLVTRQQVTALRERDAALSNQISSLRVQQMQLRGNEYKARMGQRSNTEDLQARLRDAETNVRLMQADYDIAAQVVSPYDGEVVQVMVQPGNLVGQGSSIISMQPQSQQMEIVSYVPATTAKSIRPGMQAEIIPSSVKPEEYGFMHGTVTTVADYPATDQDLMNTFQNSSLTQMMTSAGPVTEVRLQIKRDPSTESGFEWSSKRGAPIHLTPGTICSTNVVTKEERPIRMLFPYVKAKLGIY